MAKNQLPEGVGKKIVEALKRQSEIEVNPIPEEELLETEEAPAAQAPNDLTLFEDVISDEVQENLYASEIAPQKEYADEMYTIKEPQPQQTINTQFNFSYDETPSYNTEPITMDKHVDYKMPEKINLQQNVRQEAPKAMEVPANVAVLRRLISQLPAGVTKQTGAQIIRQTIEALGISMNSVLQEAQQVQDGLNHSIQDCISKVNEYKNNIMHLERHAQDYQRQMSQINDLISLFILTDKTKNL